MEEQIYNLGQKVYLVLNGVYNDVTGEERATFVAETMDWANQFLEELELEADWSWLRENNASLGTIATPTTTLPLATDVLRLVTDWQRNVVMTKSDGTKTVWHIVSPNMLYNPSEPLIQQNRVTVVGRTLRFSREFTDDEIGATLVGDVIKRATPISLSNTDSLALIRPSQLMVLGMAKNNVLPDVVNNTLTANYDVKYQRLLKKAMDLDGISSEPEETQREDLSFIGGIYS